LGFQLAFLWAEIPDLLEQSIDATAEFNGIDVQQPLLQARALLVSEDTAIQEPLRLVPLQLDFREGLRQRQRAALIPRSLLPIPREKGALELIPHARTPELTWSGASTGAQACCRETRIRLGVVFDWRRLPDGESHHSRTCPLGRNSPA
jgi:hypothetical protein